MSKSCFLRALHFAKLVIDYRCYGKFVVLSQQFKFFRYELADHGRC